MLQVGSPWAWTDTSLLNYSGAEKTSICLNVREDLMLNTVLTDEQKVYLIYFTVTVRSSLGFWGSLHRSFLFSARQGSKCLLSELCLLMLLSELLYWISTRDCQSVPCCPSPVKQAMAGLLQSDPTGLAGEGTSTGLRCSQRLSQTADHPANVSWFLISHPKVLASLPWPTISSFCSLHP